jgi:hypothetical protein
MESKTDRWTEKGKSKCPPRVKNNNKGAIILAKMIKSDIPNNMYQDT